GDTYSLIENLRGSGFNDTLKGDAGANSLTGGTGADRFIYVTGGNADTIADFNHGESDQIDPTRGTHVPTFADRHAPSRQGGSDTVINFGGGDTLTLTSVTLGNLTAGDFLFAANQPPTDISLSNNSVAENSANGTIVGALSATDPDAGETFTYSLPSNPGNLF